MLATPTNQTYKYDSVSESHPTISPSRIQERTLLVITKGYIQKINYNLLQLMFNVPLPCVQRMMQHNLLQCQRMMQKNLE